MWMSPNVVVIDTETTGTDPATARVWEIGLFWPNLGERGMTSSTLINPGEPLPPEVIELCGLGPADLEAIAASRPFDQVGERLLGLLSRKILIGYNLLAFDLPLLRAELARAGVDPGALDEPAIDVLVWLRHLRRDMRSRRLALAAQDFGVHVDGAHRTVADVRMTWGILRCIADQLPSDIDLLLEEQARLVAAQEADRQAYGYWLATAPDGLRLACGKHCGLRLDQVPTSYLSFLLEAQHTWPDGPLPAEVSRLFRQRAEGRR